MVSEANFIIMPAGWVRATVIIGTCAAVTWLAGAMLFWRKFDNFYNRVR